MAWEAVPSLDAAKKIAKAIRKAKKLSQGDLGKKVGSSGDIIGRYESDEVTPSVEVASKLADLLDVSLDYISGKFDTELDSATPEGSWRYP